MELALAVGVALAGWQLSNRGAEASYDEDVQYAPAPASNKKRIKEAKHYSERRRRVLQPEADRDAPNQRQFSNKGYVDSRSQKNQTQPFYSERKQHTSGEYKDRQLDMYAGGGEYYQKKRELPPFFEPQPQPITSGGTQGNFVTFERRMPEPSRLQNNTGPAEPIRVGPGLGLDPSTAAAGGFNAGVWRPNDDEMRRTFFEGHERTNQLNAFPMAHGGAHISNRMDESFEMMKPRNDLTITYQDRPPLQTHPNVTAQAHRAPFTRPQCNPWPTDSGPQEEELYSGASHAVGGGSATYGTQGIPSGVREDTSFSTPGMNATTAGIVGQGAYTNYAPDPTRLQTQRGDTDMPLAGYGGALIGPSAPPMNAFNLPPTNRALNDNMVIQGNPFLQSSYNAPADAARSTFREITGEELARKGINVGGATMAATGAAPPPARCDDDLLRLTKRTLHDAPTRVQPGRQNEFNTEMTASQRCDENFNERLGGHAHADCGAPADIGADTSMPKHLEYNTFTDFGQIGAILANNELAIRPEYTSQP